MNDLYWITILIAIVFVALWLLRKRVAGIEAKMDVKLQVLENNTETFVAHARNEILSMLKGAVHVKRVVGRTETPTPLEGTTEFATVTDAIRNFPGVPELRAKVRKNAVKVTAKQIAEAVTAWNTKWKARWRIQEWDALYYVAAKEDALEAIQLAGAQDVVYIPEFGDCNHFTKRSSGIVDTMLADPADNFGLGGTFGIVDDYGAGHSFLLVIVLEGVLKDGTPQLRPMMVEPQTGKEVQPSQDPKSIYYVDGGGIAFFM